jgi:hypothetical protein
MGKKKDKLAAQQQQQQQQQQQVPWKSIDKDPLGFLVAPEVGCYALSERGQHVHQLDSINTTAAPVHIQHLCTVAHVHKLLCLAVTRLNQPVQCL